MIFRLHARCSWFDQVTTMQGIFITSSFSWASFRSAPPSPSLFPHLPSSLLPSNLTSFSIVVSLTFKPSQPPTSSHHSIHQFLGHFRPPSYLHNHPCIFHQSSTLKNPITKHPVEELQTSCRNPWVSCRSPCRLPVEVHKHGCMASRLCETLGKNVRDPLDHLRAFPTFPKAFHPLIHPCTVEN